MGLGQMGAGIVSRILDAGIDLKLFNQRSAPAVPFLRRGAAVAGDLKELAGREVVFSMLSDDAAMRAVGLGDHGLLAILPEGATYIGCGTIRVALSAEPSRLHAERGQDHLAIALFGRPGAAAVGRLILVVGGKVTHLERMRPLLEPIGGPIFPIGERPEQADLVKRRGNFLFAAIIESLGEALVPVEKGGIDHRAYLELPTSTLCCAPPYNTYGRLPVDRSIGPAGARAPPGKKDSPSHRGGGRSQGTDAFQRTVARPLFPGVGCLRRSGCGLDGDRPRNCPGCGSRSFSACRRIAFRCCPKVSSRREMPVRSVEISARHLTDRSGWRFLS
ncbi:NAD(P)-dependent oxidoreductase [Methylacidimicrobium cyclopophantes]|uniref:NAD(P)-dependent oxidoreductase n=1 Tax=Methylacidimicrobium cyclopophantes TaxID=1041766 RepID=UPI00115782E9|nr:NAD(P)-dependent oxidoreductase [Methylacidimicrobium cyclopophantes]